MSIEFNCPNCSVPIFAEDQEAGFNVECLECGALITVPSGQSISSLGVSGGGDLSVGVHYAGASFVSTDLEVAFMIAVSQIQLRASYLGANAVYGFRWDIDVDSNANVLNFIGTAYGTAVLL